MNTTAIAATGYQTLTLDQMHESSRNPRRTFEPLKLSELAESLRTHGLIQPLTVRPHNGGFEIVAGARRFRAAQIAQLAGVPVRVLDLTDGARPQMRVQDLSSLQLQLFVSRPSEWDLLGPCWRKVIARLTSTCLLNSHQNSHSTETSYGNRFACLACR